MRIIAFDVGSARTGVALSDESAFLASPLCVIAEKEISRAVLKAAELVTEYGAQLAVVGLPKRTDGGEGDSALRARAFAEALVKASGITVELCDERFSTTLANTYYNQAGKKGAQNRRQTLDAAAAAVILQSYLDNDKNKKQP